MSFYSFHNPLNRTRSIVIASSLHSQPIYTNFRTRYTLVNQRCHSTQHLVGNVVLARAIGIHNGPYEILRYLVVVGEQLLCVFGQTVATVAERWIVVVATNARIKPYALDDLGSIQTAHAGIGV